MHDAIKAAVREFGGDDVPIEPLERFEFYDASREHPPPTFMPADRSICPRQTDALIQCMYAAGKAFAVVQCGGERRPYGNVLLQKGVVGPDGKDLLP